MLTLFPLTSHVQKKRGNGKKMNKKLWTKDFTIITLGSTISMLGNAVSGFAIGILVLDYTSSIFLYSLFLVVYNIPKLIMPIIVGPYLDRSSRKKVIYILDFISAALYMGMFIMLRADLFHYGIFMLVSLIVGTIDSIYLVAYDSFYPNLVSQGNMSKAYSISSMLYPLGALMVPVAAWSYENIGLTPLFLFNSISFLIAAICETQVKAKETHIIEQKLNVKKVDYYQYLQDFKEGFAYVKKEKGLLIISSYFFVAILTMNISGTLIMPYFKETPQLGVQLYSFVMGCSLLGRLLGGGFHYLVKIPLKYKFTIAIFVYTITSCIEGIQLFLPVYLMMALGLLSGMLCVTSYNIRISSTQDYLPDSQRARFNGMFQMITTLGGIIGSLIAGVLGEFFSIRGIILLFSSLNIVCVYLIVYKGKAHVKKIYNRNL